MRRILITAFLIAVAALYATGGLYDARISVVFFGLALVFLG